MTWPIWTRPAMPTTPSIDVLAIAAHRDDVEQTCGGTLLRMRSLDLRTAILDLTQGEAGTRGSAEERAQEAAEAASILGIEWRQALDIPDGRVENTWENRMKIVRMLRQLRPRVVILPYWQGRHPDHATAQHSAMRPAFSPVWPGLKPASHHIGPSRSYMRAYTPTCGPASSSTSRHSSKTAFPPCSPIVRNMPISQPVAHSLFPTTKFASGPFLWPGTMACWEAFVMQSLSCRKKSGWWTT